MIEKVESNRSDSTASSLWNLTPRRRGMFKRPPDKKLHRPIKLGLLAVCLAMATILPQQASAISTSDCLEGYYLSGGICVICEAGSRCTSGSKSTCSSGTYSLAGASSCSSCPAGHSCATNSMPVACDPGQKVNGSYSCVSCSGTEICADPSTQTTCASSEVRVNQVGCSPCPAGATCSSGSQSGTCSSGKSSEFGVNSCSNSSAMEFAASTFFKTSCPADTYTFSSNQQICEVCPAGKTCTNSGSQSSCTMPEQADLGDPTCQAADAGYESTGSASAIDRQACRGDEIKVGTSCTQCPASSSCDMIAQTSSTCGSGFYSGAGDVSCMNVPFGSKSDGSGGTTTCSSSEYFNSATSTCDSCPPDVICDATTGLLTTCQAGEYIDQSPTPRVCASCENTYYCEDGINRQSVSGQFAKTGYPSGVDCPPGYECSTSAETACSTGNYSLRQTTTCTEVDWLMEQNLAGTSCPTESKRSSARLSCDMSDIDNSNSAPSTTTPCTATEYAWYGEACASCDSTIYGHACQAMDYLYDLKCAPGTKLDGGACVSQSEAEQDYRFGKPRAVSSGESKEQCPLGMYTMGSPIVAHTEKQCLDCPDLSACFLAGTPTTCWGQEQTWAKFDQVFYLHLHDRRLPTYQQQTCVDCNRYDRRNQLCTFEAAYFTAHAGDPLTCPFQTETRNIQRLNFPDTHSGSWYTGNGLTYTDGTTGIPICSSFNCERSRWNSETLPTTDPGAANYDSKVWFLDDETYEYPYCKTEHIYFDYTQLDDHNSTYDDGFTCPLYEHRTVNYKQCEPNQPGFISPTNKDTPTETAVGNDGKYFSEMEMDYHEEYTGITLRQCPQHTSIINTVAGTEYTGGNSPDHSCFLRPLGECIDTTSNYCNSGGDFKCPSGFVLTSSTQTHTFNDCEPCAAGSYCVDGATTTGTNGYLYPEYSYEEKAIPAQAGDYVASNVKSTCGTNKYCPGAAASETACPAGFTGTLTEQFSALGCEPDDAGTSCAAGKFCPEAADDDPILCHPGTLNSGTTGKTQDDCTDCSAGKWCTSGSSSEGTGANGSYYLARTIFSDEYGCPAGKTSTGSSNPSAESSCTDCPVGSWCREGLEETTMCAHEGYVCPTGQATRSYCDAGKYIASTSSKPASGSACDSCTAGYHCSGFGGQKECKKGYHSSGSAENCSTTTLGSFTTANQASTETASGTGKWALAGDIEERDCPRGSHCTGGVKTQCSQGKYCPLGASSETSPTAGMQMDTAGLWFEKPCPSGKFCVQSGTAAPVKISDNYWTEQGATADTTNKASDGYQCMATTGSIGPWEDACPTGQWTATDTASGCAASNCEAGKYCGQGRKFPCPAGFYCEQGTWDATICPIGTYRASTAGEVVTSGATGCLDCDAGYACTVKGSIDKTAQCGAGYFCTTKATTTTPPEICYNYDNTNGKCDLAITQAACTAYGDATITWDSANSRCQNVPTQQSVCPQGFYCTQGTTTPTACDAGQFSTSYGARDNSLCIDCTKGFYCNASSTSARTVCDGGYYCPQKTADQTTLPTTAGHFTENGFPAQVQCLPGTYQDLGQQTACKDCELGKYCDSLAQAAGKDCITGADALAGHDCNALGTVYPRQCKYGEYSDQATNGACTECPVDKYCKGNALITSIDCPNGYNCVRNCTVDAPNWVSSEESRYHLCDLGKYCDNAQTTTMNVCAEGTFMPRYGAALSTDCVACPSGHKCVGTGVIIPTVCDDGYFCASGSGETGGAASVQPVQCTGGYYCPKFTRETTIGTASAYPNIQGPAEMLQCPVGTYSSGTGNQACTACTRGLLCAALQTETPTACDSGYYCPEGSSRPKLCPEGTQIAAGATSENAYAESQCAVLLQTQYTKSVLLTGTIADGYESRSTGELWSVPLENGQLCAIGQYCTGGSPTNCSPGKYCPTRGMTADGTNCDAGYYCNAAAHNQRPTSVTDYNGDRCPEGKYCLAGVTTDGAQCAKGTYSSARGLIADTECIRCPLGYMCVNLGMIYTDLASNTCTAGNFCGAGIDGTTVTMTTCGYGQECAAGSATAKPCDAGYYQSSQGQTSCNVCEAGSYCQFSYDVTASLGNTQKQDCPAGHECIAGGLAAATPCAAGKFKAAAHNAGASCDDCTAGYYCPWEGTVTPIACPDLFYCPLGSSSPIRCTDGQVCRSSEATTQVSLAATECRAGKYCKKGVELTCHAGYICYAGSTEPAPTDSKSGVICPQGKWCAAGVTAGTDCSIGTKNPYYGITQQSECITCDADETCSTAGMVYPATANCPSGKQCATDGTQTNTDPGYYSPEGVTIQLICPLGTYQTASEQGSCTACPEGKYCEPASDTIGAAADVNCPWGFYCPEGTKHKNQYPCPIGYYGAAEGLTASDGCTICPANYYCPLKGMNSNVASTDDYYYQKYPCKDGFECNAGSIDDEGSNPCPIDHHCAAGVKTACSAGTYSRVTGLASQAECIVCEPGYYCTGDSTTLAQCPAGSFCGIAGGFTSDPSADSSKDCTVGHYCPLGTVTPLKCEPGTYQASTKQSTCTACPANSFCPNSGMNTHYSCLSTPTGDATIDADYPDLTDYYCPAGSIRPQKCPIGTYYDNASASPTYTCLSCPNGKYCWPCRTGGYCFDGAIGTTGTSHNGQVADCNTAGGFICRTGNHSPEPTYSGYDLIQPNSVAFESYSGPVLRGYIIDAATAGALTACPVATFQPTFYGSTCQDCMKGRYCDSTAMHDLQSNLCSAGYLCDVGLSVANPTAVTNAGGTTIGDVCSQGKQCPAQLIHEMDCSDGFYSDTTGLSICTTCTTGHYCDMQQSSSPIACITNSECDLGIKRQPLCPTGMYKYTYQDAAGTDQYICSNCPETYYCRAGIQAAQCVAGYLCDEGLNTVPNPSIGQCPEGHYCPKGALNEIRCPFETMSVQTAQRQISDCRGCQPGYVCEWGRYDYYACPKGHWCPVQSDHYNSYINKCPPGTYSTWSKRVFEADCTICPEGYACDDYAVTNLTERLCPRGHWCPLGTATPKKCPQGTYFNATGAAYESDCGDCPAGNYCPEGSAEPIQCTPGHFCSVGSSAQTTCNGGFYCNEATNFQQKSCPVNHYCERGSASPKLCDISKKLICGYQTEWPVYCGPGFFVVDNSRYAAMNSCRACPRGKYSDFNSEACDECPAGYVCLGETKDGGGGTNTRRPTLINNHMGYKCPKGHFCPEGSYEATECPPGTYNPEEGKESEAQCLLCKPGTFQDEWGKEGCKVCGQYADSPEGATICDCIGKNRAYSAGDSTCRCKGGFDYIDESNQSKGSVSDLTDCFPLVYENCKANGGGARGPDGSCVSANECEDACNGEPGTRSEVLGVCSCSNQVDVDEICNQNCRKNAPIVIYNSALSIKLTNPKDGSEEIVDLTEVGTVVGQIDKCRAEADDCTVKSVSVAGSDGFEGTYGVPRSVENLLLRRRRLGHKVNEGIMEHIDRGRALQAANPQAKIFNPIYCIKQFDSFQWDIAKPSHFPKYMSNSPLNTNLDFDYGQFQNLEGEMLNKIANQEDSPTVFAYTFKDVGNYMFEDAADPQKIMAIRVVGAGESCADPDRFVQTISDNTMAEAGIAPSGALILQPNYALLGGMVAILVVATSLIMCSIGFCLHKQWSVSEINMYTYRDYQLPLNIHHESEEIFHKKNDFINFKSDLIDSEEDDLDNFNLDIQFDLIDAGNKYLGRYNRRKMKHKNAKINNREDIKSRLKEIEDLIQAIGNNAMASNMNWLDLEHHEEVDDEVLREQIQNEIQKLQEQEDKDNDAYQLKKEEMLRDASERDKQILKGAVNSMIQGQNQFNKEMQNQPLASDRSHVPSADAIFDNGNPNSRANKFVNQIQRDENLSQEDKDRLLQSLEQGYNNLQNIFSNDKKREEQELDKILKERLERRRKLKEKQFAREIKEETQAAAERINEEYKQKQADFLQQNKAEQQEKINQVLQNPDYTQQKEGIRQVEAEHEELKIEGIAKLNDEKEAKIQDAKKQIHAKFTMGAKDEEEIRNELKNLMEGGKRNFDRALNQADKEKNKQETDLAEILRKRREANKKKLQAKTVDMEQEFANLDIEQVAEQEKAADIAQEAVEKEKTAVENQRMAQTGVDADGGMNVGGAIAAATGAVTGLLDKEVNTYLQTAKEEEDKRKLESKRRLNKITDEVDNEVDKGRLMNMLADIDQNLAANVDEDAKNDADNAAAKRALLLARRRNKKKLELEEERVKDQVKILEEEDQEKQKITEDYVRKLFSKQPGDPEETPEQQTQRLQLLNEFLSDQFLERMSGLLMKQFTEKEQLLKLLIQKYTDQNISEASAIKKNFKIDKEKLEELKDQMPEETYLNTVKKLSLNEENILRDTGLKIQNAHKTEESTLRKELEKKHAAEQVDFRTKMANQQSKLRRELIADKNICDNEAKADKQSLEKYERSKKSEQERRLRNIELQKKTLQNQFEQDLSNKFTDFDEMLRKKRENQQQIDDETAHLRARIEERQEKIKQGNKDEGLTVEQQEALLKNLSKQLESLDSAYIVEQQRQQLIMKQKMMTRKDKMDKAQKLKEQLDRQEALQAAKDMKSKLGQIFKRQSTLVLSEQNDNSDLMKRLRAWKIAKKNADDKKFQAKLQQCEVDLNENETKIMILKLLQTEKMLKEIRRQVRKYGRPGKAPKSVSRAGSRRPGSNYSRVSQSRGFGTNANRADSQQSRRSGNGSRLGGSRGQANRTSTNNLRFSKESGESALLQP